MFDWSNLVSCVYFQHRETLQKHKFIFSLLWSIDDEVYPSVPGSAPVASLFLHAMFALITPRSEDDYDWSSGRAQGLDFEVEGATRQPSEVLYVPR